MTDVRYDFYASRYLPHQGPRKRLLQRCGAPSPRIHPRTGSCLFSLAAKSFYCLSKQMESFRFP